MKNLELNIIGSSFVFTVVIHSQQKKKESDYCDYNCFQILVKFRAQLSRMLDGGCETQKLTHLKILYDCLIQILDEYQYLLSFKNDQQSILSFFSYGLCLCANIHFSLIFLFDYQAIQSYFFSYQIVSFSSFKDDLQIVLISFDWAFKSIKITIKMQRMQNSFTGSKIFDSYAFTGYTAKRNTHDSVRRPDSLRRSQRKPIFDGMNFYTSFTEQVLKRPKTFNQSGLHIQQVVLDDFCGCQHNLDPCRHIQQLVKQLNQKDMREEYLRLQAISVKRSSIEVRRKYFKYLPAKYPQIYYAHLTNILSNLGQQITVNQFYALAWIEYHAKLEHLTYFLFSDLKKSLKNKKKFVNNLEIQLIKYQVNYPQLINQANQRRLPLEAFLSDFYESVGAIIVPLSQYATFLKLLLKSGSKIKLKLLVLLIVKKRQSLFELIKHYAYSISSLRQQSRQLAWQLFFDELVQMR